MKKLMVLAIAALALAGFTGGTAGAASSPGCIAVHDASTGKWNIQIYIGTTLRVEYTAAQPPAGLSCYIPA